MRSGERSGSRREQQPFCSDALSLTCRPSGWCGVAVGHSHPLVPKSFFQRPQLLGQACIVSPRHRAPDPAQHLHHESEAKNRSSLQPIHTVSSLCGGYGTSFPPRGPPADLTLPHQTKPKVL